ncbi:Condensin complex subunit 3 [Gracilariopsis chorda]|uniref:Condensin complex subunit 3 n=1 Tax=Gracilariopsis chorda TaxID=448386 RepID=A0A2V3J2A2_9FLOR|nr:Condensin complex subunit 3 [Gracilariopsis chorda]|eukprot:PXF48505.1 Condensin complex subunit 3 [Gracilariopsis chorda]
MPSSRKIGENVSSIVAQAFSTAQSTAAAHPRATSLLLRAYNLDSEAFLDAFTHALNRLLLVFSRDPHVERLVVFVSRFAAENTSKTANFCSLLLTYLIHQSSSIGRAVRFRSVQIIAAILNALPENADISEGVWDLLDESLINRSQDRLPRVRAAAAGALCRIQTSGIPDDDIFCTRLLEMVSLDSSAAVRKAALNAIALTEHTIPSVVARIRDVNEDIRASVYRILAKKLHPNHLSLDERVFILSTGLRDRSATVRDTCEQQLLLSGWLDGACQGNVFELVELLGAQDFEEEVLQALRFVFVSERCRPLVDAIQIDVNNMRSADVLILRAMSHTKNAQTYLQRFLPTTTVYADVLRYYAVDKFAIRHLLDLCRAVDISDEVGRVALEKVLRTGFIANKQTSEEVVPSAVRALRIVMLDANATLQIVLEILRNDILLQSENATDALDESGELQEWRRCRSLNVCLEMLRIAPHCEASTASSVVLCMNMLQLAALPHILSEDESIRKDALECLALYCLLDGSGDEARSKMPLFVQSCKKDVPRIQELAMKVLADFLMLFDFRGDMDDEVVATVDDEAVKVLSQGLTDADASIRTAAAQGLSRLLFLRRIRPTPKLLSQLLIIYHNPITEEDELLRQCLSLFFPAFSSASSLNRVLLEDAFKPTCQLLIDAPESSPLVTVNVVQVAQFVLHLTNPSLAPTGERTECVGRPADLIHERLSEIVLNELIDAGERGDDEVCRIYSRILSNFRFQWKPENCDKLHLIRKLTKVAQKDCEDRRAITLIKRFQDRLDAVLEAADDSSQKVADDESTNRTAPTSESSSPVDEASEATAPPPKPSRLPVEGKQHANTASELPSPSDFYETESERRNNEAKTANSEKKHDKERAADPNIGQKENENDDPNFVFDVDSQEVPVPKKYPKRTRKKRIELIEID